MPRSPSATQVPRLHERVVVSIAHRETTQKPWTVAGYDIRTRKPCRSGRRADGSCAGAGFSDRVRDYCFPHQRRFRGLVCCVDLRNVESKARDLGPRNRPSCSRRAQGSSIIAGKRGRDAAEMSDVTRRQVDPRSRSRTAVELAPDFGPMRFASVLGCPCRSRRAPRARMQGSGGRARA